MSFFTVCPVIDVTAPSLVATGGTLNLETVVITKPRPQPNSITVIAYHLADNKMRGSLEEKTDGVGHHLTNSTYSFFHSFPIPPSGSTGDTVQVIINWSGIPKGPLCEGNAGVIHRDVQVVSGKL